MTQRLHQRIEERRFLAPRGLRVHETEERRAPQSKNRHKRYLVQVSNSFHEKFQPERWPGVLNTLLSINFLFDVLTLT